MVIGNVSARGYINNNGEAAASLDLTARSVRFLGSRSDGEGYQGGGQQGNQQQRGGQPRGQQDSRASNYPELPPSSVDDIPF